MRLSDCHNIDDFRKLAKRRLPWPVFDYIDGAADDEITKERNTAAYADVDLVPDVLAGVAEIDTSITIMGRNSALPLILSPTALQRVFHWQGERAVARAAEKFGLWCGISSLATVSIEEIAGLVSSPKLFQLYVHKDRGLNTSMIERCKAAKFDAIALTVDTIVGGKRERCARSGFSSPPRFTPSSQMISISPPTASTISSTWSNGARLPSSCRPPWLEIMIASAPISTARRASAALITPLRQKVPPQSCRIRAAMSQSSDWSSMSVK